MFCGKKPTQDEIMKIKEFAAFLRNINSIEKDENLTKEEKKDKLNEIIAQANNKIQKEWENGRKKRR